MTFNEPHHPMPSSQDDGPAAKPRSRSRSTRSTPLPVALPIQTRLVPNCAWPSETDALPARRAKRR